MARQSTKQENEIVYVLHTYPFKETSLIVEIFSKVHGRISIVAKGARRPRSLGSRNVAVLSVITSHLVGPR